MGVVEVVVLAVEVVVEVVVTAVVVEVVVVVAIVVTATAVVVVVNLWLMLSNTDQSCKTVATNLIHKPCILLTCFMILIANRHY
jgi:hypothetical protein